jgi:hypothetical protein
MKVLLFLLLNYSARWAHIRQLVDAAAWNKKSLIPRKSSIFE